MFVGTDVCGTTWDSYRNELEFKENKWYMLNLKLCQTSDCVFICIISRRSSLSIHSLSTTCIILVLPLFNHCRNPVTSFQREEIQLVSQRSLPCPPVAPLNQVSATFTWDNSIC